MLTSAAPRVQDFPAVEARDTKVAARASRPLYRERPAPGTQTNPGAGKDIKRSRGQMTRTRGQDAHATAGGTPSLHSSCG